jgi:hypothetical protein
MSLLQEKENVESVVEVAVEQSEGLLVINNPLLRSAATLTTLSTFSFSVIMVSQSNN